MLPVFGALGLLASGFVDMLDGAVARATGSATRFSAVYDHVLDRYAEFAVLLGIGFGGLVNWVWVIFCLFGMVMASFTRESRIRWRTIELCGWNCRTTREDCSPIHRLGSPTDIACCINRSCHHCGFAVTHHGRAATLLHVQACLRFYVDL